MRFKFRFGVPGVVRRLMRPPKSPRNVLDAAHLLATHDSAAYYVDHMLTAAAFPSRLALLSHAVAIAPGNGLIIEAGVASGQTINHIAGCAADRQVFGFDSFDGLPENWRTGFAKGAFAGWRPLVADNVTLIKGLFSDTLTSFLEKHHEPVALLHIDCDLYSSTATILEQLKPRLHPGAVIVFDEYWNYPGWRQHEFKAFQECRLPYHYVGIVPDHEQVCVVLE